MKKLLKSIFIFGVASILFTSCNKTKQEQEIKNNVVKENTDKPVENLIKIKVGATLLPHSEILNFVKEDLKDKGIDLEIIEFSDYLLINPSLTQKEIDANFFQHLPYFDSYVEESGDPLISMGSIHIEPLGIYSKKITSLDDLKEKAVVTIPDDGTNRGRALHLLDKQGLIKLKKDASLKATKEDIAQNPKNLEILEVDAAFVPRSLSDSDIAVINGNYALEAGIDPLTESLVIESSDNPYANIIAIRKEDENNPNLKILFETLRSEKVKEFIIDKFKGAVIPTF